VAGKPAVPQRPTLFLYGLLVLTVAFFTYFRHYDQPADLFWDENYHIASAQKYLDRVMFMEPHPPLGKMFIALGEHLFKPNRGLDRSSFLTTDYVKNVPRGYSFRGVRFFPTLFATLSGVVFFFILFAISKNAIISLLFSSLYLFENAFIVHSRGAMLEGVQMFFTLLSLWYFLVLLDKSRVVARHYLLLGLLVGLNVSVKLNGLLLLWLFPALFFFRRRLGLILKAGRDFVLNGETGEFLPVLKDLVFQGLTFVLAAGGVLLGSYYLHYRLGQKAIPGRYYQASDGYRRVIDSGAAGSLAGFPVALRDNLRFIPYFEKGVPKYDVCKKGENGSLPFTWPFGNKSINYRWEKSGGGAVKYLYLQGNPLIWFSGLIGLLLAVSLVVSRVFFGLKVSDRRLFFLIKTFLFLYVVYMYAVARLRRVLYLYHYFIPLTISLLLAFTIFNYLFGERIKRRDRRLLLGVGVFAAAVILVYAFFAPLTYYRPLTTAQFQARQWFTFWKLEPVL
jgi:dolichyl-phosphate-mannose--protein O-mannosyl transferase